MKSFKNILGEEIKTIVSSKASRGTFNQFVIRTPIGFEILMHQHSEAYDSVYVIKGIFQFNLDGAISVLKAGDSICIPPQSSHSYINIGDVVGETIATHVPGGMDHFFDAIVSEHLTILEDSERIKELAQQAGTVLI